MNALERANTALQNEHQKVVNCVHEGNRRIVALILIAAVALPAKFNEIHALFDKHPFIYIGVAFLLFWFMQQKCPEAPEPIWRDDIEPSRSDELDPLFPASRWGLQDRG